MKSPLGANLCWVVNAFLHRKRSLFLRSKNHGNGHQGTLINNELYQMQVLYNLDTNFALYTF